MARDVNDIVVLGFGSWSDVYGLPTLGYGTEEVIDVAQAEGYRVANGRPHYRTDGKPEYKTDNSRPDYRVVE